MKRLLSVVAIMVLAASLLPVKGFAGLRGAFDPITIGDDLFRGKFSPVLRGFPTSGSGTATSPRVERWITFFTLSQIVGSESVGEIYLQRNVDQAAPRGFAPVELKRDATGMISYIDPAWSNDGKWLLYVQTDNEVSSSSIYIQQYDTSTATDGGSALGSPILVADGSGGVHHRHPVFNASATQVAYDSDAFGAAADLWTVNLTLDPVAHTGTVNESSRTRHQLGLETDESTRAILNGKAEFKPDYSPDGTKLAYVTNRFGTFQIQILTMTSDGLGETTQGAESNPTLVTHDNPSWSSDGLSLYYDAPSNEDPANPQDVWKLDLASGAKCPIFVDLAGDVDPDVSQYTNVTRDGIPFNYFVFISQGAGFGVQVWRTNFIQTCVPPLPLSVVITPSHVNLDLSSPNAVYTATVGMTASSIASGYVCRAVNIGGEGIRTRVTIIASPTLVGLPMRSTPNDPSKDCTSMYQELTQDFETTERNCFDFVNVDEFGTGFGWWTVQYDTTAAKNHRMNFFFRRRTINARIVALGLTGQTIPLTLGAYTNTLGRSFQGFGYVRVSKQNAAGSTVALMQNSPNPFNPSTRIDFAVDLPGQVSVRVFNTRGELVRTISDQWYPQGLHTVSWDGRTQGGGHAPSGIYYIKAKSGESTDVIKAVLAK